MNYEMAKNLLTSFQASGGVIKKNGEWLEFHGGEFPIEILSAKPMEMKIINKAFDDLSQKQS